MAVIAVPVPEQYVGETLVREQSSLWADAWRRLRRNRLALVSTIYLIALLGVAGLSVFYTPYSFSHHGGADPYEGLGIHHLAGGDQDGRDIFTRLMVGAQISLMVGIG